jgi:hypothetical protein
MDQLPARRSEFERAIGAFCPFAVDCVEDETSALQMLWWRPGFCLARIEIDGSEDAGWSSAYRRGPATATAWLSREGSSERAQMRGSEGGRCRRETSLQIESVSDNVTPTRSAIAHVGRAAAGCAFPVLASALPIAPTKSPKTNDATSSVA